MSKEQIQLFPLAHQNKRPELIIIRESREQKTLGQKPRYRFVVGNEYFKALSFHVIVRS